MEQFANLAGTTLVGGITAFVTSITVANGGSPFPATGNFRIRIDTELMIVTAVAGNVFTVTRGAEGTTAASHSDGAQVVFVLTAGSLVEGIAEHALDFQGQIVTISAAGTYNNQSTTSPAGQPARVIRCTHASGDVELTGLASGSDGRRVIIEVQTAGSTASLDSLSVSSSTGNQVQFPDPGGDHKLHITGPGALEFEYNNTSQKWVPVGSTGVGTSSVSAGWGVTVGVAGTVYTVNGPYNTRLIESFGTVTSDGSTDNTAAFTAANNAMAAAALVGGHLFVEFGAGLYLSSTQLKTAAGCGVKGQGSGVTVLKTTTSTIKFCEIGGEDSGYEGLSLLGTKPGVDQRGFSDGTTGSTGSGHSRWWLRDCVANSFDTGFWYEENPLNGGAATVLGPRWSGCLADQCGVGYNFGNRGEYVNLANCSAQRCTSWGTTVGAGNITWGEGQITENANGVYLEVGSNASHGAFVNVQINHNTTIAIEFHDVNGEQLVGCNIFAGQVLVTSNARTCSFVGCRFDPGSFEVDSGGGCALLNCSSGATPTLTIDPAAHLVIRGMVNSSSTPIYTPAWAAPYQQKDITAAGSVYTLTTVESYIPTLVVPATSGLTTITSALAPSDGAVLQRILNLSGNSLAFAWSTGATVTIAPGQWADIGSRGSAAAKLAFGDASGGGGGGSPGGATNSVQYYDGTTFAGAGPGAVGTFLMGNGPSSPPGFGNVASFYASTGTVSSAGYLRCAGGGVDVGIHTGGIDVCAIGDDGSAHLFFGSTSAFTEQPVDAHLCATTDIYLRIGSAPQVLVQSGNFEVLPSGTVGLTCNTTGTTISPGGTVGVTVNSTGTFLEPGLSAHLSVWGGFGRWTVPRIGDSTPFASEGRVSITLSNTVTLSSAQYSRAIWKFTGTLSGSCTVTIPAPASEDASYTKDIEISLVSGGPVNFTTGTGTSATFALTSLNSRARLHVTTSGVEGFGVDGTSTAKSSP